MQSVCFREVAKLALSKQDEFVRKFLLTIGTNVIRKRGQMSQGALAEKAGVSRSTVAKIEAGKKIELDLLLKIAVVGLGAHPGQLFYTDKEQVEAADRLKRIEERQIEMRDQIKHIEERLNKLEKTREPDGTQKM